MRIFPVLILTTTFFFSCWLMFHTFSYSASPNQYHIAAKAWSDFGGHLPLIRSFVFGSNWPPQNPLFPGEPIRYHFLFYAMSGWLEQLGFRPDLALNSLSIFGFWGMLVLTFFLTKKLTSSNLVATLATGFVVFNGSLSFLRYFEKHGLTFESLISIPSVTNYPSFGPWDGSKVAANWNLNIFTNQRHLAPGIALALLAVYTLVLIQSSTSPQKKVAAGICLGLVVSLLIFINQAIFAALVVLLFFWFILDPKSRLVLLTSGLVCLPAYIYSGLLVNIKPSLSLDPGFLITPKPFTASQFLLYWLHNFGFHLLLLPVGWILAPKKLKMVLPALLTLFFIGNYYRLSPDMFNNHKLFNFIVIFLGMYSAVVVARLWSFTLGKPLAIALVFLLTFSGIIDFFATKNDTKYSLADAPQNPDVKFFLNHTFPSDVVLNSNWFYHPASLAGRPIFSGYTYFTWSHGYNQTLREQQLLDIYRAPSKLIACQLLKEHSIAYVELKPNPEEYIHPNWALWYEFQPIYENPTSHLKIYSVKQSCP